MKKKILLFAAIVVVLVCIACLSISAVEVASGTCGENGDNLTWTLDEDGTLTISGEGEMEDGWYPGDSEASWYDCIDWIKSIVIKDGVTSISQWAFLLLLAYECDDPKQCDKHRLGCICLLRLAYECDNSKQCDKHWRGGI